MSDLPPRRPTHLPPPPGAQGGDADAADDPRPAAGQPPGESWPTAPPSEHDGPERHGPGRVAPGRGDPGHRDPGHRDPQRPDADALRTTDGTESDARAERPVLPTAEGVARPLDPRIKPVWIIGGLLNVLQLTAIAALLDFLVPLPLEFGRLTGAVAGVGTVLALITPFIRYRRWRYALRPHDLWIRQGLLTVQVSVIPYRRLQFVDTRSGPIERAFGLRQLVVHTAALGTSGRLPGLEAEHAERLRETLAELEPEDALV